MLDASVLVKWLLPERRETGTELAEMLLGEFVEQSLVLVEPPHWIAEVIGVVSRLAPEKAPQAAALLCALEIPVESSAEAYVAAAELAVRLEHHVFDTLYHGVALVTPDTVLITADDAYFRKARVEGGIMRLADVESRALLEPSTRRRR